MGVAPCIKDGCFPQSSPPDRGEIREREQAAETFSVACWKLKANESPIHVSSTRRSGKRSNAR